MSKKFDRFKNVTLAQDEPLKASDDIDSELDILIREFEQPSIVDEDGLPKLVSETANEVNARLDSKPNKALTNAQSENIKHVVAKAKKTVDVLTPGEDDERINTLNLKIKALEHALSASNQQLELFLPVSERSINTQVLKVKVSQCRPHPLNTRALSDHNRHTLSSRMASFRRQGQLEPALATECPDEPGIFLIVDGAGRLKTWELLQKEYPGEYDGEVFLIRSADIPNKDVRALSKTRNESEPMSDWNLAQMYQVMLDDGIYEDMKSLCESEGLVYKTWLAKMQLTKIPKKYVDLFVRSADIPKTLPNKINQWERSLDRETKHKKDFDSLLNELIAKTQSFVKGESAEAPYPIESGNPNVLIKKLDELVKSLTKQTTILKEKPISFKSASTKGIAKKDRNGRFSVKFEKCDDATFTKILEFIETL